MTTPATRTPVRIARGAYADLNASIADILDGEICWATDEDKIYVKDGGSLVATMLTSADVGVTVQGYDATILKSADIGASVQGYDVNTAKYDDTTANFTGTLQNGGSDVLVDTDIGLTLQAYDADTAKTDVAQTFTAVQTFSSGASDASGSFRVIPQNTKTSSYTLVADDTGKHISITTGGVTIPASVFSAGDVVSIYNNSGSNQTITQGSSTTVRQAGTSNTGNRTLAQYGVATLLCVGSNTFVISGAGLT